MPRSNFDDTYNTSNAQAMMPWWFRCSTPLLFHFYKVHDLDLPELYRRGYRIRQPFPFTLRIRDQTPGWKHVWETTSLDLPTNREYSQYA
jgi:hypothetical protein